MSSLILRTIKQYKITILYTILFDVKHQPDQCKCIQVCKESISCQLHQLFD